MKITFILLGCLLNLVFLGGCGDTEEASNPVTPSLQDLPADDDIEGLYNLGIPRSWYLIKDPVLYTKYFRAQLLRQFGNIPEIHIVADMTLKERQWIYPTRDEYITYLRASYRLWRDPGMLESLQNELRRKAEGKPFALIYADAPAENIIKRLEEIYQRKLSREEALLEVAIIKGDDGTLESFGWKKADMDDEEFEAWKAREPERFVEQDPFVPGGGIMKQHKEMWEEWNEKQLDDDEDKPDEEEEEDEEDEDA